MFNNCESPLPSGLRTPTELIVDFISPIIRSSFRRVSLYENTSPNSSQTEPSQLSDIQQDLKTIKDSGITLAQMATRRKLLKNLDKAPRSRRPYAKADGSLDYSKRSRDDSDDEDVDFILNHSLKPKKQCSDADHSFSSIDASDSTYSGNILDDSLPTLPSLRQ